MPRNGSGTYTLPQPAFVTGTKIASAAVNSDFSDVASALTQSVSQDGQTPMTGVIKNIDGSAGSPGLTFVGDTSTGFFLPTAGELGISIAGVQAALITASGVTWAIAQSFPSGIVVSAGGAAITGNSTVTGSLTVTNGFTVSGGTVTVPSASISGASLNISAPTVQTFLSGSGTYTPTSGLTRIKVRMAGGGGGGGSSTGTSGGSGGQSSFGGWTANGGSGGSSGGNAGGAGGSSGSNGTGTAVIRVAGGAGSGGNTIAGASVSFGGGGGAGGNSPLGGGGGGGSNAAGGNAGATNTGGGGGGAGNNVSVNDSTAGAGGGAGEYVEFWMTAAQIGASKSYAVGAAGSAGSGGASGGVGGSGAIYVEEFYW